MSGPDDERGRLIRVQGPAMPVIRLASEVDPRAPVAELIRVQGSPIPLIRLTDRPVPTATVRLTLPLQTGADGEAMFQTFRTAVEKVNEVEALFGRSGVWMDGTLSHVKDGEVVIVLAPNDSSDARETCKRVADYLFAAARSAGGVRVKVFEADRPDTPVYELAA
jgi:hypothetical protein